MFGRQYLHLKNLKLILSFVPMKIISQKFLISRYDFKICALSVQFPQIILNGMKYHPPNQLFWQQISSVSRLNNAQILPNSRLTNVIRSLFHTIWGSGYRGAAPLLVRKPKDWLLVVQLSFDCSRLILATVLSLIMLTEKRNNGLDHKDKKIMLIFFNQPKE